MNTPPLANRGDNFPSYSLPGGIYPKTQGSFINRKTTSHDVSVCEARTAPDGRRSSQEAIIKQRVIDINFIPISNREVTTPRESPGAISSSGKETAEIQQQTTSITINSPYSEDVQMDSLGSIGEEIAKTKQSWTEPQRQTMPTTRHHTPHPRLLQIDSTSSSDESSPSMSEDTLESGINNLQLRD